MFLVKEIQKKVLAVLGRIAAGRFLFFFFFGIYIYTYIFRAAPTAHGGSQAKGRIRAAAATYTTAHSNARSPTY